MNIIKKFTWSITNFFGALSLSFGGLIVKSFEGSNIMADIILEILIFLSYRFNFFDNHL